LEIQRAKDFTLSQMAGVVSILHPKETATENDAYLSLLYALKAVENIPQMNKALTEAIEELTVTTSTGEYQKKFHKVFKEGIAETVNRADSEGICADIIPLFENYVFEHSKAKAKDTIVQILFEGDAYEDEAIITMEAEFNKDGGLVDQCEDTTLLSYEITYATFRRQLYDLISNTQKKLDTVLSGYENDNFITRLNEAYAEYEKKLLSAKLSKENAEPTSKSVLEIATVFCEDLLNESKVERYLLDNKTILQKNRENIDIDDEYPLRSAITSYLSLQKSVRELLTAQINDIVEKYKLLTIKKARGLIDNDVLYQDFCDILESELKSLTSNNIDVFYKECDLVFKKSQGISELVLYYRELLASPIYASASTEEKELLESTCKDGARKISAISADQGESFDAAIELYKRSSLLALDHCAECARVRLSLRGSSDQEALSIANEACAKIKASADRSEMIVIADKAIFRIEQELTKKEIERLSELFIISVKKMKFISDSEKESYIDQTEILKRSSSSDAAIAKNITVLSFVWETFCQDLSETSKDCEDKNLAGAKEKHIKDFENEVKNFLSEIKSMEYIPSHKCVEFSNSASQLILGLKNESVSATSCDIVSEIQLKYLKKLNVLLTSAQSENLIVYKQKIIEDLNKFKYLKNEYSEENYNLIESKINDALDRLELCSSMSECSTLLSATQESLSKVNTLLEQAKANAKALLDASIRSCRSDAPLYSKANMNTIESIYSDAIIKINSFTVSSDIPKIDQSLSQALISIRSINKDITYSSSDVSTAFSKGGYPDGYDLSSGLYASVSSPDGILSDAHFSVMEIKSEEERLKDIQKLIRSCAKRGTLISSISLSEETLDLLKKCVVSGSLDISLSNLSSDTKKYSVKLLFPKQTDVTNVIGLAFITESGNVEFYNIEKSDDLILFDLSHFSEYFIVSEKTTNLTPIITFLAIILSLELISLIAIFALHLYRKRKEKNMFPLISAYSINPLAFTFAIRVIPKNGTGLAVLLSVAVLALGCGIAILTKLELNAWKQRQHRTDKKTIYYAEPESKTPDVIEESKVPVLCASGAHEMIEEVSKVELDIESSPAQDDDLTPKAKDDKKIRRAEINLDVIANSFSSGELVTLDALKKRRLIGKRTEYVKILARGSLTKPLVVEANDFSRSAEEMLKAVGGEAIRVTK